MSENKNSEQALNPSKIMALSTAYWDSQVLLTANRIGLFTLLSEHPKTLQEISAELGIERRGARLLLNACIALELVQEKDGNYANSDLSKTFLSPGQPAFLGDAIRYSDDLYQSWGELEQVLRTGEPARPTEMYTGEDLEQTRNFVYGMHNRAMGIGRMLVDLLDLSQRQKMIDVGGGPGTYSALIAQKYPRIHSTVLDLSGVLEISREIIENMGVADRVTTQSLNYLQQDFPRGNDLVLISGVFHRESEQTCQDLIRRADLALDSGGMLVVSDIFTDPGGAGPLFATLFGLNMMLTAPDGGIHSDEDVGRWMQQQDYVDINKIAFPQPMPHRIVTGIKK